MTHWQSGKIQSNGITLHYTRTGGAKPALLALHGFSDDGLCWSPIAQALEADFDVIMLDARGHGRSDDPETGYGYDAHAADVAGAIEALGLIKPIVLGHSMGAVTALALAATHPRLPGTILLEDPPPFWMPPPPAVPAGAASTPPAPMRNWIVDIKRLTRDEMTARCKAESPHWPEGELGPWADAKLRFSFNVIKAPGTPPSVSLRSLAAAITCPVLLIIADTALGAITSDAQAADLKTLIPQLKIEQIGKAGHSIRRDQQARYLEIVRVFALGS